jgi:hypothetical protein
LYPDTVSPVPALSANDWLSAIDREPQMMSLKVGLSGRFHDEDESVNVLCFSEENIF